MGFSTLGRPHAARLRYDLDSIRTELLQTAQELGPEHFDWSPRAGMRSPKHILQEIGTMEMLTRQMASTGALLDWTETWASLEYSNVSALLEALAAVRTETIAYLDACSEETIETPIPLPVEWQGYFGGATEMEPEELMRWVVRHEYYHLGQLNTYQMYCAAAAAE